MKKVFKYLFGIFVIIITLYRCADTTYKMGDLTAPTDLVINTEVVGATTAKPNGDGSGDVKISISATNALAYKVDYDANNPVDLVYLASGSVTKKYTTLGLNTYTITALAYGKGGTTSTVTKNVTVRSDFTVATEIVTNLTGGTSKTWAVDASLPGQIGVGPWDNTSVTPSWWAAAVNEKVACCNCFYTTTFKFSKDAAAGTYSLPVTNPDGAFTKTGSLTTLPGIPAATPSTQTSILLAGNATYIGYGACLKEYEIMVLTPTYMYLRVQGTETGNAWYLKLKAL